MRSSWSIECYQREVLMERREALEALRGELASEQGELPIVRGRYDADEDAL
jgi:hypothetical protein